MGFTGMKRRNALTIFLFPKSFAEPHADVEEGSASEDLAVAFSRIRQEAIGAVPATFRVVLEGRPRVMDGTIRDQVYRVGRKALLNAFLHADATEVELNLEYAHNRLRMAIRDNGKGIDPDRFGTADPDYGSFSWMRLVAERMGAKFRLLSRVDAGTEVELSIPADIAFASRSAARQPEWGAVCGLSA
jgi:signal transduction histidine kinase